MHALPDMSQSKPPCPERVPKYGRVDETFIAVYEAFHLSPG
jgi:hypothetical protein